jgi:hypothetical protein
LQPSEIALLQDRARRRRQAATSRTNGGA